MSWFHWNLMGGPTFDDWITDHCSSWKPSGLDVVTQRWLDFPQCLRLHAQRSTQKQTLPTSRESRVNLNRCYQGASSCIPDDWKINPSHETTATAHRQGEVPIRDSEASFTHPRRAGGVQSGRDRQPQKALLKFAHTKMITLGYAINSLKAIGFIEEMGRNLPIDMDQ